MSYIRIDRPVSKFKVGDRVIHIVNPESYKEGVVKSITWFGEGNKLLWLFCKNTILFQINVHWESVNTTLTHSEGCLELVPLVAENPSNETDWESSSR